MEKIINRDIVITLPKTIKWSDYEKELEVVADGSSIMNFKINALPKTGVGSRCYILHDGFIKGYMLICGMVDSPNGFTCTTTGTQWGAGKYIQRKGKFFTLPEPIPMTGFQGFRYF